MLKTWFYLLIYHIYLCTRLTPFVSSWPRVQYRFLHALRPRLLAGTEPTPALRAIGKTRSGEATLETAQEWMRAMRITDVTAKDGNDLMYPIHYAILADRPDLVRKFLDEGADFNARASKQ